MYEWVVRRFRAALWAGGRAARATRRDLARQTHFLEQLVALVKVNFIVIVFCCFQFLLL